LRQAGFEGDAKAYDLAMLEDEVALAENRKHIYGTEISITVVQAMVAPMVDPRGLDERRAAVGLPPIDEYLRKAEAELGMPVDRRAIDEY
jgi:hypothetical protein